MADTELLFLHQSRATEEAFSEAAYRWPDQRGRDYVSHYLGPQTDLFPSVQSALAHITRSMESGALQAESAENHISQVRMSIEEGSIAESSALRLSSSAVELAGVARTRSQNTEARARTIVGEIVALGSPPI